MNPSFLQPVVQSVGLTNAELVRLNTEFSWSIAQRARFEDGIWSITNDKHRQLDYPQNGHSVCAEVEEQSFWFLHRNKIIGEIWKRFCSALCLPLALWEIGSGNGIVASYLQLLGAQVIGVEPRKDGAVQVGQRGVTSICAFFEDLELPPASLYSIGCFDVLEHLADPRELLAESFRTLKPGGIIIVTVPAHQSLWSQMDDISGHHRRYSERELKSLFVEEGFQPLFCSYFMASMVLPLYWLRTRPYKRGVYWRPQELQKASSEQLRGFGSGPGNLLAGVVLDAERFFMRFCRLPFGSSLIGVFCKPDSL